MPTTNVLWLLAASLHLSITTAKIQRPARFDVNIGRFKFPMTDDRLPTSNDIAINETLENELYDLWERVGIYWESYVEPPPQHDEAESLQNLTQSGLTGWDHTTYSYYSSWLMSNAEAAKTAFVWDASTDYNQSFYDLSWFYGDAIANLTYLIDYYRIGAYMGVGYSVECSPYIDDVLTNKPEWEKAGSAAATTLMALIPTFLAFGNLYVPRSSEAFATSMLIGITSALYGLGLPVQSVSAVRKRNILDLSAYGMAALRELEVLGSQAKSAMHILQSWSDPTSVQQLAKDFAEVQQAVILDLATRWHLWHTPALLVAAIQIVMFALAVAPLLIGLGVPRFIFNCTSNWTGRYLGISAGANAFWRLLMWQVGYHEKLYMYALSDRAKSELEAIVATRDSTWETTATQAPPLYPPLVSRLVYYPRVTWAFIAGSTKDKANSVKSTHHLRRQSRLWSTKASARSSYVSTHPLLLLRSGVGGKVVSGACRWRPLIVLLHLSSTGRNFLMTLFTGMVEVTLYVLLTFFFASQWGGNLVITGYALLLLLIFVTAGRAVSLIYVYYSSRLYGLHIVRCENDEQILGCLKIFCSMQDVLVRVNSASYFDGIRLEAIPGDDYAHWLKSYERGEFDDNKPLASGTPPTLATPSPSPSFTAIPAAASSPSKAGASSSYTPLYPASSTPPPTANSPPTCSPTSTTTSRFVIPRGSAHSRPISPQPPTLAPIQHVDFIALQPMQPPTAASSGTPTNASSADAKARLSYQRQGTDQTSAIPLLRSDGGVVRSDMRSQASTMSMLTQTSQATSRRERSPTRIV